LHPTASPCPAGASAICTARNPITPSTAAGASSLETNSRIHSTTPRFEILDVNTVANYDPDIIPLLDQPAGSAWARNEKNLFEAETFPETPP